ncbi:transposable element Tcb1 transposase [Trichonephila clavipes]|nr:transposable element Tcb1 transposase [Trichonephila clavipes]
MTDLSEFEKGMIVGMRCAGCSVTETAIYLGCARSTLSAVMTAYKKCGNVTSGKHNSGRKRKLTDRDKRVLTRIVARKRKQSLSQITSEVNSHLRNPISARTVQRELHASNLYGRVGIRKPLVTACHALQRRQWCRTHRQWTPQQWQQVIWSDESTFPLFQTTGSVYVWRTPKEAFAPECIVPTVKHGCGSLMTSFPGECPLYQDDNAPIHTAKIVQEWFAEHEGELKNNIDADSDDENEMKHAAPVRTSSEKRNVRKNMRSYLDSHSYGERNNKMDDIEQFVAKKTMQRKK